ncbi:MAG TPA: hypothetical protein PLX89_02725 [Verrucomicrobiota bacterium]|nr:hypothetical protein [Verrucomicrobiales bacterium]HRI11894.1 hypothetical protein [Verrucomicrobiota bacterium]
MARWLSWGVPSLGTALVVASLSVHPIAQPSLVLAGTNSAQLAALDSASAQSAQNALPVRSFAWTNAWQPLSTNGSPSGLN